MAAYALNKCCTHDAQYMHYSFSLHHKQRVDSDLRRSAEAAGVCAGGKLLGKIAVGEVSNIVFAGDVLIMLQEKEVTAAKLAVRGPPLPGMFEAVS